MTSSFIVPLDTQETQDDSLEVVGGKGRSLARLANAGFDVPGGFQVTAAAYLAVLERWRVFTPGEMTNRQLLEGIRSLNVADARYWHVLRRIIGAAKGTDMALQTFLERNAPGEGFASGTFLSGFKSKVVDAEMAMRAIAEQIRGNTRLYELIIVTPASRLLDALRSPPQANDVVEAIETYLDDYGKQVFNLDFAEPALFEAPLPFIKS